jgi:hypothetical protein
MEMVYRGFPVEQARPQFEELKGETPKELEVPVVKVRRKLRIPATNT